ncbi:MAG: hypothetical protein Q4P14_06375 [Methanobacteriaceae archaeon]|nr:hypothetical protein [Methanobacteriaceae archaeon]
MRMIWILLIVLFFIYIIIFNLINGADMLNIAVGITTLSCISGLFLS